MSLYRTILLLFFKLELNYHQNLSCCVFSSYEMYWFFTNYTTNLLNSATKYVFCYTESSGGSSSFTRMDQKRHSLTSLARYQNPSSASSISSRNSIIRRSAFIPRNNRRMMSSIIEHQRKYLQSSNLSIKWSMFFWGFPFINQKLH